ncbi:MAG: VCBS repeat-containing protein, partial [Verrucomicrobiales bacterium]|nr:VCBS repeat-containing protein [Verrucomicrobiales bacterium]
GQRRWKKHAFAKAEDWPHANTFIAADDFDGDGRRDLVLAPSELKGHRYRITWFEAPADPRTDGWRAHVAVPDVETVCHFVGAADFDGDDRTDIAYAHMPQAADPDNVRVVFNRGHQDGPQWIDAWEPLTVSEAGSHSLRVLDADGDGRPDLFGANWNAEGRDEHVKLWLNRLHTSKRAQALPLDRWRRHVIDEANPWPAAFVGAVDLDGDGKPDVVAGGSWYRNPGSAYGKWERLAVGEPFNNFAGAFDLNGDGDIDLFGTAWKGKGASSQLVWARNHGGRFTVRTNIARPDGRAGFGSTPPEGIVYFTDVLGYYLQHRPAARLLVEPKPDSPLGQVLARVPAIPR